MHQAHACLSDCPLHGSTPYARFKGESIERSHVLRVQWLHPQSRHLVSMGLAITIPQGYYGHMVPCNSLALRGADIVAGVIDSNYPEEVKVEIHYGDQIAELIYSLRSTRQPGGFKSTGN
uniref:dUTPase-like domain-containing protein n=1 Tax=Apteryx owenii TaxID=8824 RepID=A0A8B9Q8R0_APTOW